MKLGRTKTSGEMDVDVVADPDRGGDPIKRHRGFGL